MFYLFGKLFVFAYIIDYYVNAVEGLRIYNSFGYGFFVFCLRRGYRICSARPFVFHCAS